MHLSRRFRHGKPTNLQTSFDKRIRHLASCRTNTHQQQPAARHQSNARLLAARQLQQRSPNWQEPVSLTRPRNRTCFATPVCSASDIRFVSHHHSPLRNTWPTPFSQKRGPGRTPAEGHRCILPGCPVDPLLALQLSFAPGLITSQSRNTLIPLGHRVGFFCHNGFDIISTTRQEHHILQKSLRQRSH